MKSRNLTKRRARFEALEGRLTLSAIPGVHCTAAIATGTHHASEAVVAAPVTHAAAKSSAKTTAISTTSSNWSGYAVSGAADSVTNVAGTWTVPTVSTKTDGYSAVWVGIDGYSSTSVEQLGTGEDVSNGQATYYAWYEMYPAGSVTIASMTVKAGDSITASVKYDAANKDFVLTMTDTTESTAKSPDSFTITLAASSAQRSSAEWVVEAPSSNSGVLTLANFGTTTFTNAYATISGTTGAIDAWQSYAINLVTNGTTQDTTSALTDSGNASSFTVTYDATTSSVTPTSPTTPTTPTTTTAPQPQGQWGWGWGGGGWGGSGRSGVGWSGWASVDVTMPGVAGHGGGWSQLAANSRALRDYIFASPETFSPVGFSV